jgi:class 3 adenylate cyclase/predicted ATPase
MDFYDILDQVIALLQQRGKASYRALKLQFKLDDASLDVLKDELIKVHQLARDHDGEMLIWTGDTLTVQAVASQPIQTPQPPAAQATSPPDERPSAAPRTPEAERRQLTVMFCDLVDSTKLSSQLDPEDWRDVVRAYQRVCTEVIQRYDGHIAQLLGDGLLIYFGYPVAHEDDAQRAVRTGLSMLAAMGDLHQVLQQDKGIQLAIRVGIHTGLVVVGEMGGAGRQEQLALGEVPNIASRIEGLAAPNTVAISEATYRLIQGYFECRDLGAQALRGVTESMRVYHVLSESGATSRLEVAQPRGLTPLVGREQEVGLLLERWEQAKAGHGQVVLLTGDAGIGKSRLVQVLKDSIAHELHVRWECRSAEYYQNAALYPLVDLFQRLLRFDVHEASDAKLEQLEHALSQYRLPLEETVPLFAPLLSLPIAEDHYPPLNLSPQRQRQKTLETIITILLELAEPQPVLFILEDLHWTDPTTLEWLNLLIDQTPTAAMLVLLTCRPHFQPAWHHRSYLTEITVYRLSQTQAEQIVTRMTDGKTFLAEVVQQIVEKTDGVPLFVEEMTKAILESGALKEVDEHYELTGSLSTVAIPATLQDSLMARLDRLISAKGIAQLAAVIGRQFSYELLQAISQLDAMTLQRELGRLVEAELVYQRGLPPQATYTFKHALIQDAAYASLLKSTRQQYHQRIGQVLEGQFSETVEAQPELIAHHLTEAGLTEQSVTYWYKAGQRASEHSAHMETIAHLRQGLALLATLPETPARLQRQVDMLIVLGASLIATKGWAAPEVGETYTSARQLCEHLEDPYQLFPVLWGLWSYSLVRAEYQTAHTLGEQLVTLAQHTQDPVLLLAAHRAMGATWFYRGVLTAAHTHLAQGSALYDATHHRASVRLYGEDAGVVCGSHDAEALWQLGYPDQAWARSQDAVRLAQQMAHPLSLAYALGMAATLHQMRREWQTCQEHAEATIRFAQAQGFPSWIAVGAILRGWALVHQGQAQDGIAQIHQGWTTWSTTGAAARPDFIALLAEAYGTMGQPEAGLTVLADALRLMDAPSVHWLAYYDAELYRLKGALLLQQSSDHQAEAASAFHHALALARTHHAKSLELRAATSLARLWQQQGKRQEAYDLLAPVYNWFTEGFDTLDLQEAKALLVALR